MHHSLAARAGRAAVMLLGLWLVAAVCIFLPIAHFVLVPGFALGLFSFFFLEEVRGWPMSSRPPSRQPAVLCALALAASAACTPGGADTFTREEQTLALDFRLVTGTARSDLWALGKVSVAGVDTDTLVHNRGGARWDALTTPELELGQGGYVSSLAAVAKNEVWVASYKSATGAGLWLVNGNGGVEDHSSEVPAGVHATQNLQLSAAGGTLLMSVDGNSAAPQAHLYRRVGSTFEELPGLPSAAQFTVLAARGPDDLYLYVSSISATGLLRYLNGTATPLTWDSVREGPPVIALSATGEAWFWKASGNNALSFTGQHGDGATFTPWTTQGWPDVTAQQQVSERAFGMVAVGPGKLAMLVARSDGAATQDTERSSLGVNFLDAEGKVTAGPRLLSCLSSDECAVGLGAFAVLGDTVIISANGAGKIWFTGPLSSLQ